MIEATPATHLMEVPFKKITAVKVDGEWIALRKPPIDVPGSDYLDLDACDRKEGVLIRVHSEDIKGIVHS